MSLRLTFLEIASVAVRSFDSPSFVINMHVTLYQGNQFYSTYFLDAPQIESIDIQDNINNPCIIVPPNICVEEGRYTFELDLPIVDESYNLVYQRCCRNNTITNILDPQSSGSTYTIEITPEAQALCNSTPTFLEYPPAVLCVGQPFTYDFSATDEDGDQLVYEFCSPLLGGGNQGDPGHQMGWHQIRICRLHLTMSSFWLPPTRQAHL